MRDLLKAKSPMSRPAKAREVLKSLGSQPTEEVDVWLVFQPDVRIKE